MKRNRIYLAGKFQAQSRLKIMAGHLNQMGYTIVGTWLDEEVSTAAPAGWVLSPLSNETHTQYAKRDLAEVMLADLLILDTIDDDNRGGREVEFGIALARGIPTVVVGPLRNIFHHLATQHYCDWTEFFQGQW